MKLNVNRFKLKWKMFAYLLGFCALLFLTIWLLQTFFTDSLYKNIKIREIKHCAKLITDNIDDKNLPKLIDRISNDENVCIEVIAGSGKVIYSIDVIKDCVIHDNKSLDKPKLISNARNNKAGGNDCLEVFLLEHKKEYTGFGYSPPKHKSQLVQSIVYVRTVKGLSGEYFAVLINANITPLNSTVKTLQYQLYIVIVIMLILAALLALIITKRISRPIEEINKSAKVLATGNYDTYFDGKGFLEIGELSDTLNTAAAELKKVESLRRELLANISHDLRTPLSLIYGYAEVMHDFPGEITKEQTRVIMDETLRLSSLVNDVLDISKLESGVLKLKKVSFNLTQSIESTTLRIAELVKKDDYKLTFTYDGEVVVSADEDSINQVFYNLLVNAINYTGENKVITVRQIESNENVRIEVIDTGRGIAPKDIPYIWDRYYKVDKNHKRSVTGTGLGLAIVKMIMELHGGKYGVESSPNGKGSTFWFSLKR